jgi:hypothetical protein
MITMKLDRIRRRKMVNDLVIGDNVVVVCENFTDEHF